MSLALISATFAAVALDEAGHEPRWDTRDAMDRLRLDSFYLGQLFRDAVPAHDDGTPMLGEVVEELAAQLAPTLVATLRTHYPTVNDFLCHLVYRQAPEGEEPCDLENGLDATKALQWIDNGCPLLRY